MAKGGRVIVKKSRRGIARWKGDEEEEDDEEYIAEEEEEAESESYDESLASSSDSEADGDEFGGNSGEFSGSDGSFEVDSDYEFDESEFEEEEEIRAKSSKNGRKKSGKNQAKTRRKVSDSEEDDDDLNFKPVPNQNRRRQSRKNQSEESDYEEEEDFDDSDKDEDFTPDIEEEDEESVFISKRKNGFRKERTSRSPVKKTRKNKRSVSTQKKPIITKNKEKKKTKKKRRRGRKRSSPKEPAMKRRKRMAQIIDDDFIVDDDADDDDDDFMVEDQFEVKKKNKSLKRKPLSDSETSEFEFVTSDEDEFVIQEEMEPKKRKKNNVCKSESDSSDSDYVIYEEEVVKEGRKRNRESEKGKEKEKEKEDESGKKVCLICLSEEQRRTTRGVLDCCAHFFCFACIVEWSKVESRCPVCKRRFETITKASSSDSDDVGFGAPRKVIKVPKRDQVYQPSEEDIRGMLDPYENVVCMECQLGGDDNLMLLCDICDSSAHTYCVGLGNSVPEGNWYCDCCRSAGVGPSNPQPQAQPQPQSQPTFGTADSTTEIDSSATPQPTASSASALEIDLNAPPRDIFEEASMQVLGGGPSQLPSPSAGGAATLSGRRAIRNRIRILLSSSRPMQVLRRNGGEGASVSNGSLLGPRVGGSVGQQGSVLAPHRERSGPQDAEGAKEQVRSMVKNHLKRLCLNSPIERDTFKEVARRATYTILAACGFGTEHRNLVSTSISAPNGCFHEIHDSGQASLLAGSCSACFDSFVRDVVMSILNRD